MATKPVKKERPIVHDFFVLDPNPKVVHLGGIVVSTNSDGKRIVRMTDAQAQYWVDQGAISRDPLHRRSNEAREVLHQMGHAPRQEHGED